jgi:hypothetical protein
MKIIDDKIYIIENFISNDAADFLFESFKDPVFRANNDLTFAGPGSNEGEAYKVCGAHKMEKYSDNSRRNIALDLLTGTCVSMEKTVSNIHKKELRLKSIMTCFMISGGSNPIHVDNSLPDQKSDHAALLYLNEEYEGGELIFPKQNFVYKPKKGTFITFFGDRSIPHGVREVLSGTRSNIISFYDVKNIYIDMEK